MFQFPKLTVTVASTARDYLALLFTPTVTAILVWLICILAYHAWDPTTQPIRLHYLGALSLALALLVGLGGQWFQRNRLDKINAKVGGAEMELGMDSDPAPVTPPSSVTTTTTTEVKS